MAYFRCENLIHKTVRNHVIRKPLTTIGRATGNDLVLEDPTIGTNHATIVRKGTSFSLSVSGTSDVLVNGHKVKSADLKAGDKLIFGAWQLTWNDGEPTEEMKNPTSGFGLDALERLVVLSDELMRDTAPNRLFATLLKGLVQLTRAERGFIIVLQDGQRHLAASHNVDDEKLDLSKISDSIVQQVIDTRSPLIVSDAMHDQRFGRAKSVVDLRLSSVMCVPLIYRGDLLGVIYLGNDSIADLFTDKDLGLLKIYASQASLIVYHALMLNQLRLDNRNLRDALQQASQGSIIGTCLPMKAVFKILRKIAPTDLSVLILGETGTGKEMIAHELHALSDRKKGPFIAINCGAIPENLLESELFGHRKGSFTGAVGDKVGKIEAAHGGTLFLDEIGEMPMNLQVKLLRVLQERVIERVGDLTPRPVNIRIVSATHKNLQEMIQSNTFREDLFYRLNDVAVQLPPLRERGDDIEVLAQFFLNKYREQYDAKARGFNNTALTAMRQYYWPGNVRELESRVKKAAIMSDRVLLNEEDLGVKIEERREVIKPLTEATEEWKLDYIRRALDMNQWNKAQTARDLGVDARTIFRYIEKLEEHG